MVRRRVYVEDGGAIPVGDGTFLGFHVLSLKLHRVVHYKKINNNDMILDILEAEPKVIERIIDNMFGILCRVCVN